MKKPSVILQFKISLKYSNPLIWRTIQLDADCTFIDLHDAIQAAFAWEDYHLWEFVVPKEQGGSISLMPNDNLDFTLEPVQKIEEESEDVPEQHESYQQCLEGLLLHSELNDAQKQEFENILQNLKHRIPEDGDIDTPVRDLIDVGDSFFYTYDMGDNWEHEILCEAVLIKPPRVRMPRCIDGAMNHAFEDVGGVWGYTEIVEMLKDPKNPEYQERIEWLIDCYGRKILKYDAYAFDVKKIKF